MPTYRSTSDFSHSLVLSGRKYLIRPGEVIKSDTKLSYIFLEEVSDSVQATVKEAYQGNRAKLQQTVSVLEQQKEEIKSASQATIESLKQEIEQLKDKIDKDISDLTDQINKQLNDIETKENENRKKDEEFKNTTNKRLNILKDAIRTMEEEVYGVDSDPK